MSAGRLWSSLLLLLPLFCSKSSSCGLSTHVEIGKYWALCVCVGGGGRVCLSVYLSVLQTGSPDIVLATLEVTM
jgi:hypothetical protein